ncbi:MAG TPA: hypothetical protein VMG09_06505 [Bacteroidota bacterium]|nr:hypothetical protein [Bacteroidota bacterium]
MADDDMLHKHGQKGSRSMKDNGFLGGIYGMSFFGAAFYFIGHAASFWGGVLGFLKAIVWPALVMYKVLELLNL